MTQKNSSGKQRPMSQDAIEALIQEQIEYYRKRAPEYDLTTSPVEEALAEELRIVESALRAHGTSGRVLEVAAGTGRWTQILAERAQTITALDASPEMLQLNRVKVASSKVRYVAADFFSWLPDERYDAVFFGFWLSHVPLSLFDTFWNRVASCLVPQGTVLFVDEAPHGLWREDWADDQQHVVRRRLMDSSQHAVAKVLWPPPDLAERLQSSGWHAQVHGLGALYWGAATRPIR